MLSMSFDASGLTTTVSIFLFLVSAHMPEISMSDLAET
jgi:hypothetical protein